MTSLRTARQTLIICRKELKDSLRAGLDTTVKLRSSSASLIKNGQVHAFRPGASGIRVEYDFHFRIA